MCLSDQLGRASRVARFVALLLLVSPPNVALAMNQNVDPDPDEDEQTPYTWYCTVTGGAVMGTRLPADCKRWWPGCSALPPPPRQIFPKHCKYPKFKLVRIPIENSDGYIDNHEYSTAGGHGQQYSSNSTGNLQGSAQVVGASVGGNTSSGKGSGGKGGKGAAAADDNDDDGAGSMGGGAAAPVRDSVAELGAGSGGMASSVRTVETRRSFGKGASLETNSPSFAPGMTTGAGPGSKAAGSASSQANVAVAKETVKEAPYQAMLASRGAAGIAASAPDFGVSKAEAGVSYGAASKKRDTFTDPWLDYVSTSSREELVDRLSKNAKLREDVQRKINNMSDGSGASDPAQREKIEYYRNALAEAQARIRGGGLEELAPLGTFEAFAMNGDETDQEIKRLLASMDEKAADLGDGGDGFHYPLFPRVHRALWRQLANGNINVQVKAKNR